MKAKIYDANFLRVDIPDDDKTDWYEVKRGVFDIYGSIPDEELLTLRMPLDIAATVNRGTHGQCIYGSGVRMRFSTNSKNLSLKVVYGTGRVPSVCTATLAFGFDIYSFSEGRETYVTSFVPANDVEDNLNRVYSKRISFTDDERFYTLNFPHFDSVKSILLGVDNGSIIGGGAPYENEEPIVFYGSSITHGASASNPGNTYQNFIAHKYNYNFYSLGFSGNACGEKTMAEYISHLPMKVFVCDYDHNASSPEKLRAMHYPFYEVIRKNNPELPYVMISRPDFFLNPEDSRARREVILESFRRAKESGDENVYFIDGERLFDGEFYHSCTVDGVHPNDIGFMRMGNVIGRLLHEIIEKSK